MRVHLKVSDQTDRKAKDSSEKPCIFFLYMSRVHFGLCIFFLEAFTEGNKEKDSPTRDDLKREVVADLEERQKNYLLAVKTLKLSGDKN